MQQPQQPPQSPYPPAQYVPQGQYPAQPYPVGQYPVQHPVQQPPAPTHRSFFKDALVFFIAAVAGVYLVWPSLIPDFVPDVLPLIGQVDDNTATLVLLSCFRYYGIDLTNIFLGWQRLRGR